MSANMDTTGTFAIAKEMSKVGAKTSTIRLRLIRSYLIFCYCFFFAELAVHSSRQALLGRRMGGFCQEEP